MALRVHVVPERTPNSIIAWFHWSGTEGEVIDRQCSCGLSCGEPGPKAEALLKRVVIATQAQKIFGPAEIKTDISNKTYISAPLLVLGRHLNADLLKLGF